MIMDGVVKSVLYDWFYTLENGEEYQQAAVGRNGVVGIVYHAPVGEGDRHYCDVIKNDGTMYRIFNINNIAFEDLKPTDAPTTKPAADYIDQDLLLPAT